MTFPRSGFAASLKGGDTSGPAKPVPRRPFDGVDCHKLGVRLSTQC